MRKGIAMHAGLVAPFLALLLPGCILTSGQITISFDLQPIHVTGPTGLVAAQVDLNSIGDYSKHKDELKDLTDVAILGDVTNRINTPLEAEFWVTSGKTNYILASDVRSHGILLWGPLGVPGLQTLRLDWNGSAGRFTAAGREALVSYVKSGGEFTVYALSSSLSFDFSVDSGVVVIVLDAGI